MKKKPKNKRIGCIVCGRIKLDLYPSGACRECHEDDIRREMRIQVTENRPTNPTRRAGWLPGTSIRLRRPQIASAAVALIVALVVMRATVLLAIEPKTAAQSVKAVVRGPATAKAGDLVILDATSSPGAKSYAWRLAGGVSTYLVIEDGKKVVFSNGTAGEYLFWLGVAGTDSSGKLEIDIVSHTVIIGGGPGPQPGPDPSPEPEPEPGPSPLPEGRYDLAKFSFNLAVALPEEARKHTSEVATNFSTVSTRMVALATMTIDKALKELFDKNIATTGNQNETWKSVLFVPLQKQLSKLNKEKKMVSKQDHADALREISIGLKAVK